MRLRDGIGLLTRGAEMRANGISLRNPELQAKFPDLFGEPSSAGPRVNEKNALGITAFWAGVDMICSTVSSLPLEVVERLDRGGRRNAIDHPVHRLLHVRPNPRMSPAKFKYLRLKHLLVSGNSYVEIERDRAGRIIALWPLPPDKVRVEIINNQKFFFVEVDERNEVRLGADRVLHVHGLGDGKQGWSPIHIHSAALGLSIAVNEYGARFFANSARPSGIIKHPGNPSSDAREQLRTEWNQVHQGLTNAQRTAVLWGGMEWQQVGLAPEDAQFLGTRDRQIEEVARILRINPILLQHHEKATTWGSGIEQFMIAYEKHTIRPWLVLDEEEMSWSLFSESERGRMQVKYNPSALLRGDAISRAQALEIRMRNGTLSQDEWRELEDENPLPGDQGTKHWMPLNMAPIEQVIAEMEAEEEAGPALEPPPPPQESDSLRPNAEQRSVATRERLRRAHLSSFRDGFNRLTRREVEAATRVVNRAFGEEADPQDALNRWIDEFYPGHHQVIIRTMAPIIAALSDVVAQDAAEEIGEAMSSEALQQFRDSYAEGLAVRETSSSIGQIRTLMLETEAAALQAVLIARFDDWAQTRPEKVAENEIVRVSNAAARDAWQRTGVSEIVWRANTGACPICQEMDGRRVGIKQFFVGEGESVNPGGGVAPLVSEFNISGPPLHRGCTCSTGVG